MYPLNSFINTSAKITSFLHSFLLAQEKLEFGEALAKKIEQLWDINGKIRTQTEQANPKCKPDVLQRGVQVHFKPWYKLSMIFKVVLR